MDREVHLGETPGLTGSLDAVDRDGGFGSLLVAFHEVGGVDEHAAGPTRWIEHPPVERLQDFDEQPDDALDGLSNLPPSTLRRLRALIGSDRPGAAAALLSQFALAAGLSLEAAP